MVKVVGIGGGKSSVDDLLKSFVDDLSFTDDIVESSMAESFEHQAYDTLIYRDVDDSVDSKQVFRNFVSGKRSNRKW